MLGVSRMAAVLAVALMTRSIGFAQVVSPRVATDQSVDCHSLESIVAGLCRAEMSEQDKAIVLYEFTRRVMFHYPQRSERLNARRDLDTLTLINTYGYCLCSQQMLVLVDLWRRAGIKGTVWGVPGHSTAQAEYGGGLHWFDPLIGAYVFGRDGKTVASLDEVAKDPTILTKAVEEQRACPGFLPCGRVLREDAEIFCKHAPQYIKDCQALVDDLTFMAAVAGKAKRAFDPNKPLYQPDLTLRRGESVTYLWDNLEGEFNVKHLQRGQSPKQDTVPLEMLPPHHFCGIEAERRDAVNARYWMPYEKTVRGVRTGRYQANGRHIYAPDLAREPGKGAFGENTFGWTERRGGAPALRVGRAGQPSALVWRMRTPHVYTSATVTVDFVRAAGDDVSRVLLSRDSGKTWTTVYDAVEAKAGAGVVKATVRVTDAILGTRDAWLKVESATTAEAAKAGIDGLRTECVFQHNMFARPFLVPGVNKVTVTAAEAGALTVLPVKVRWDWKEGDAPRSHVRTVAESPAGYAIDVGGKDMPRMLSLEISVP